MINNKVFENDLIGGMVAKLAANKKSKAAERLGEAVNAIHAAVEIFEEKGMTIQADACLEVLAKIANFSTNVQTDIPSIDILLQNGLTIDDWKSAMSGNLLGRAKLNQSMRNSSYNEEQMQSFLGSQYMSPKKTEFILEESIKSEEGLGNIGNMLQDTIKGLKPEEFQFTSVAGRKAKRKALKEDLLDAIDAASFATFEKELNKKMSSLDDINLADFEEDFIDVMNSDKESFKKLLDLDVDGDLEVVEEMFADDEDTDFEDD